MKNNETEFSEKLGKAVTKSIDFILKLSDKKQKKIIKLLKNIQKVQKSNISNKEKTKELRMLLWTNQTATSKLLIGAFVGSLTGLLIFGTGGAGIAALGTATGFSAFLLGTAGGTFISSVIQNYEKKKDNEK